MLNDAMLNRVSHSFRRGYHDGHANRPMRDERAPENPFDRPFADFDYREGHKAGRNDAYWTNVMIGRNAWRAALAWVAGDLPAPGRA